MADEEEFSRSLSAEFLAELVGGLYAPLVSRTRTDDLDLQIRRDQVSIYHQRMLVLDLSRWKRPPEYRASIEGQYLHNVSLGRPLRTRKGYHQYDASAGFIEKYLGQLPLILANARKHSYPEGIVEHAIVAANRTESSSVIPIDRQVQVPGDEDRARADLVGLAGPDHDRFAIIELKQGLNPDIPELNTQIAKYHRALTSPEGTLRSDIHQAYRKVIEQKQKLGYLPEGLDLPSRRVPVECRLVLYDYNPKSTLLPILRTAAKDFPLRVLLAMLQKGQFVLPPEEEWEVL